MDLQTPKTSLLRNVSRHPKLCTFGCLETFLSKDVLGVWKSMFSDSNWGFGSKQMILSTVVLHLTQPSLNSTFPPFSEVQMLHLTQHSGKPQKIVIWGSRRRWKMKVLEKQNPTHLTQPSLNSTKIVVSRSVSLKAIAGIPSLFIFFYIKKNNDLDILIWLVFRAPRTDFKKFGLIWKLSHHTFSFFGVCEHCWREYLSKNSHNITKFRIFPYIFSIRILYYRMHSLRYFQLFF